jgi:hypothetical protein
MRVGWALVDRPACGLLVGSIGQIDRLARSSVLADWTPSPAESIYIVPVTFAASLAGRRAGVLPRSMSADETPSLRARRDDGDGVATTLALAVLPAA